MHPLCSDVILIANHDEQILTHLHADLSDGPGGVITHRDELRVQIRPQDRHELS